MPFLIALIGIATAAYFWFNRARNAAHVASDLADMARDVRLAARRIGFQRKTAVHAAESVEDPGLAVACIALAFVELGDFPTDADRAALNVKLRSHARIDQETADEQLIVGRWLVNECGGPSPAVSRLSRKLNQIQGHSAGVPLLDLLNDLPPGPDKFNEQQVEALHEVKNVLRKR